MKQEVMLWLGTIVVVALMVMAACAPVQQVQEVQQVVGNLSGDMVCTAAIGTMFTRCYDAKFDVVCYWHSSEQMRCFELGD